MGSVVAVTSSSGTLISQQRYMPFGEVRELSGGARISETDYGYTGQRRLGGLGLMDYRARFYDAALGRFTQPDSMIPNYAQPQTLNRFTYVLDDPLLYVDPTGNTPILLPAPPCEDSMPGCASSTGSLDLDNIASQNDNSPDADSATAWDYVTNCVESLGQCYLQGWSNFGSALSVVGDRNRSALARTYAGIYIFGWGGAHVAVVAGGIIVLRQGLIILATYLFTERPDAATVSIGRFPEYLDKARAFGYTAFNAGRWYNVLDALGIAKPANQMFMQQQLARMKDFVGSGVPAPGTAFAEEVEAIANSGNYLAYGSGWVSVQNAWSQIINWFGG